jgi:exosortase A-associated hydrolase 2
MHSNKQAEVFFLTVGQGQRLCIYHPSHTATPSALVLYIHPLAEEMNKTRRMTALQSRALAQAGFAVLQIDLMGCGDSSDDFGDATWELWVNDVVQGSRWLRNTTKKSYATSEPCPLWLWGLRAGCLLAVAAAEHMEDEKCNFLFWQPPISGQIVLNQLLRIRQAGDMLSGKEKVGKDKLSAQLEKGDSVEISGYLLSPELASGLSNATLQQAQQAQNNTRLEWIEISPHEGTPMSTMMCKTLTQWRNSGVRTRCHRLIAPMFWQSAEIEIVPEIINATLHALAA